MKVHIFVLLPSIMFQRDKGSWVMTPCSLVSVSEEFAASPAMKAVCYSQKFETTYQTARCHIPEICDL
jgi:hypothetical protein